MERKRTIPSWLLSVFLLVCLPAARAASQTPATLMVSIQPTVYFEAPSSIVWEDAGEVSSLQLPLTIKVRLNRGAYADLSVSRTDQTPVAERDSVAGWQPSLEVAGVRGITALSEAPVVLRRFSQSGVYRHSVVLRFAAPPRSGSYLVPLLVRLSSNDGLATFSIPLTVRLEAR